MAGKWRLEDEQITQELYLHSDSDKMGMSGDSDRADSNRADSNTEVDRQIRQVSVDSASNSHVHGRS
jgi:hypothetical protein